ncbi:MAG: hypothetical protein IPP14_03010 [Planctomycetes bacterium]|nr:hypothetical protein [Planctomycetota bacterium]
MAKAKAKNAPPSTPAQPAVVEESGEAADLSDPADIEALELMLEETHGVLKQAVERAGPKRVARALDVSLSLVYKWTQPPRTKRNPQASGARNPLDKLITIFSLSQDLEIIHFLCQVARGYYTANPAGANQPERNFVSATVSALNDFADMLHFAEKSLTNDGRIDDGEAAKLRKQWDRLKGRLEQFIVSCEEGQFNAGAKSEPRRRRRGADGEE